MFDGQMFAPRSSECSFESPQKAFVYNVIKRQRDKNIFCHPILFRPDQNMWQQFACQPM